MKASHVIGFIGTSEAGPCYKARFDLVFSGLYGRIIQDGGFLVRLEEMNGDGNAVTS